MIIKGLFRRYERWNPVHPTAGAFWGMGIGVGCGVGWGPGFGPEVIGYVGAGCGAGFCVGLTLAGIGIGLPANALIEVPCNAAIRGAESAIGCARSMAAINMAGFLAESQEFMDSMTRTALRNGMNSMQPIKSLSRRTQQALQRLNSSMRGPGNS